MMWIKICGMNRAAAVGAALDAGADALGFVFAESRRRVSAAEACALAKTARGRVPLIAVMRHPSQHEVDEVIAAFAPDALQTDAADLRQLRLPAGLRTLPVLRALPGDPVDKKVTLPAQLLFEGAMSGSGRLADWEAARLLARRTQLILAGGLSEHNIAAAIETVRPYGVDVSSGVESSPGVKDAGAIARFIAAARNVAAVVTGSREEVI